MPSPLETLIKILKLEKEQGCKNNAVSGGLAALVPNWTPEARARARKPEHFMLVDELTDRMQAYAGLETREERDGSIRYMLDRITGRAQAAEPYRSRRYATVDAPAAPPDERSPRDRNARDARPPRQPSNPPDTRSASENEIEQAQGDRPRPPRDENRRPRPNDATGSTAPDAEQTTNETRRPRAERPPRPDRPARLDRTPSPDPIDRTDALDRPEANDRTEPPREESSALPTPDPQPRRPERKPFATPPGAPPQPSSEARSNRAKSEKNDRRPDRPASRPPQSSHHEGEREFTGLDDDHEYTARTPIRMDIPPMPRLARPPRGFRPELSPDEIEDRTHGLDAPVEKMKGVGPKMGAVLEKIGIFTIRDLLFYQPRRYDDYTQLVSINRLKEKQIATVIGTIQHAELRIAQGGRKDFFIRVDDGTGPMSVTYFAQPFLVQKLRPGQQIVLRGVTTMYKGRIQMTSPDWEYLDVDQLKTVGIVPVYGLTAELSQRVIRGLIRKAIDYWSPRIPDPLPVSLLDRAELADLGWALAQLHFPESPDHLSHAKRRLVFDEVLTLQLAILESRREWQSLPADRLEVDTDALDAAIAAVFPYPLTGAQRRAVEDVRQDVALNLPMNRLLQGDVGAGKTAVAIAALIMALMNGKQAALMAPTGILAEQHVRGVTAALAKLPPELLPHGRAPVVAALTGAISAAEREAAYAGLADGSIDVAVGTHAIIESGVQFRDLGVAVIDEQHRFGVEQRGALRGKGTNPHLLVMTATPIPRTMALTIYADLDLSILDEMPPGRIPIRTRIIDSTQREKAYNFVEDQLDKGRQAFIVYPLVEASETIDAESAVESFGKLQQVFNNHKVGLLHGKMRPIEKDEIMAAFREKSFDVLVTTSVAEVGVDIPNASVIMIEGANRFGLAQLHQFRGRVGRGGHASYCLLVSDTQVQEANDRLRALEMTTDGFKLAEIDWKLRGAGDLIGTRQSGGSSLLDEMSPDLVELAQREARTILQEDPDLALDQHQQIAVRVAAQATDRTDMS